MTNNLKPNHELENILVYINNNLNEKLTLKRVYEESGVNKNLIESYFKKFYGTTFYGYIRRKRYKTACEYLKTTDYDFTHIAHKIGLSSSQNFSRFFRSMSGMTPTEYRKINMIKNKTYTTKHHSPFGKRYKRTQIYNEYGLLIEETVYLIKYVYNKYDYLCEAETFVSKTVYGYDKSKNNICVLDYDIENNLN